MLRICLFVLFLGIAIGFGDCENNENNIDCTKSAPGSDNTHVKWFEKELKRLAKKWKIDLKPGPFRKIMDQFNRTKIFEIFPGTLWCGNGNISKSANDLGYFNDTDACCRAHDECKYDIVSNETLDNLRNNGFSTRSACYCDRQFYNCLKNVSSIISKSIGITYFDILRPQCFVCTCPTDNCQIKNDNDDCSGHCTKFKWVDNKKFI